MKSEFISLHGIRLSRESHTLVTGQPGTGKTRVIVRPLIRAFLSRHACPDRKVGLLLLDAKGDMLPWLKGLLEEIGRANDLVVIGGPDHSFNIFDQFPLTASQASTRIAQLGYSTSGSASGKDEGSFWRLQQEQMLQAMLEVGRLIHPDRPTQIQDLCDLRFQLLPNLRKEYEAMAARFAFNRISPEARSILRDFGRLADETRESVLAVVGNGLNAFRESPLRELMNPTSLRPNVDLAEIIESGKCVVVSCVERSFGNSTLPLLMAVKEAFADLILSRKDIERESATETWTKINQHREILYIADECHRLVTRGDSGGELDFLDLCREFNCRAILATQSLSALESVMGTKASDRLVSLFGHHVFLSNIDPSTAAWADRMFDTGQDKLFPPPLLRTNSCQKKVIDWRGPQTLASLRTGEFIIRTRDGDHYRRRGHLG